MSDEARVNVQELVKTISDHAFRLRRAKSNGTMIRQEQESMKNILMNNVDQILEALSVAAEADEKISLLEMELDDADKELDEKDAEIRALKGEAGGKPTKKGKTLATLDGE